MKRFLALLLFTVTTTCATAQDSTQIINHELGFNTVLLIKQVISNNPSASLATLPYAVFYNIYFKDLVGIRLGLGYNSSHLETEIEGQPTPRVTDRAELNLRAGLSYNFVHTKRLAFNVFADYVRENTSLKSSNTSTVQSFPNPISSLTVKSTDITRGTGAQLGFGVKYNLIKNLSLYAEVPFTLITRNTSSELRVITDGFSNITSTSLKNTTRTITLPTTVYLVLRF